MLTKASIAGLRRDSKEVRAQIVEHDEYISYPFGLGYRLADHPTATWDDEEGASLSRGGERRHMSAPISCQRLFVEERASGLVKTQDRPAASKLVHKTGPNLQTPPASPTEAPGRPRRRPARATAPPSAERPS